VIPDLFKPARGGRGIAVILSAFVIPVVVAPVPAHHPAAPGGYGVANDELPSPPKPPSAHPDLPASYHAPTALTSGRHAQTVAATVSSEAKTWGDSGSSTTLVLYDSTGEYGWLGELYAIGAGNLATHFGKVTAEPVVDYVAGQVNDYTTTIYLGSTYNEPLPSTFLDDVLTTAKPVIWAGDNVWQLTGTDGSSADTAFESKYGWNPSSSYFDETDSISSVSYQGTHFTRNPANTAGIVAPHITNSAAVDVLASANCASTCATIAQTNGKSFPWAISSGNIMYLGEIPFSYISMTDRYVAFADLLFRDLAPRATPSHLALVRLENVSPHSSPVDLDAMSAYLKSQNVRFSVATIPQYLDPKGVYGARASESLVQEPAMVSALKTAVADGATLVQDGYTHQYSDVDNPFTAVTGDDYEFYRARCATSQSPPLTYVDPCANTDYVIEPGPLPHDSQTWAYDRVVTGRRQFALAGLPAPTIWTTPLYAASAADYAGIGKVYSVRYEQELFFGGELTGGTLDYSHVFGQFFPYEVHDLYGTTIIPEDMGDYEPSRTVADLLTEGRIDRSVTQGVASFFVHPDDDPLSVLKQLVSGIKGEGYTFVSPAQLMAENG
jgi:uncharacterized protein YdaL